jgi:murein L,D-transpeptidase YafK
MRLFRFGATILALGCLAGQPVAQAKGSGEIWVLVDTQRRVLEVLQDRKVEVSLANIAIGRYGTTRLKHRGDNQTPLGSYHVAWMEPRSHFHFFIGLDYPTPAQARAAADLGLIKPEVRRSIDRAFAQGRVPPQNTPLGGMIGIHGLGPGDPKIHSLYNWTRGCVALTNRQVDVLLPWIRIGTRVEVR